MSPLPGSSQRPREMPLSISIPKAVTFDCWQTLMVEVDPSALRDARVDALARCARDAGRPLSAVGAREVLDTVRRRHTQRWHAQKASGSDDIASWALESLQLPADVVAELTTGLARTFAEVLLTGEVRALAGSQETLQKLAQAGIRRALICDTGFSPGRVLRPLLARLGLLDLLEVQVFSDEVGVAKPHPRMFERALSALSVEPGDAVHVGDLRRTDIAGARAFGMGSIRISDYFDDQSDFPEADHVAASHAHLCEILGLG